MSFKQLHLISLLTELTSEQGVASQGAGVRSARPAGYQGRPTGISALLLLWQTAETSVFLV